MPVVDYHDQFAACYDSFYQNRDVTGDALYASKLLELDLHRTPKPFVLDFGCGTGSHVLALADMGYSAIGFDRSTAMIAMAQIKAQDDDLPNATFKTGSFDLLCNDRHGDRFDGIISLFQVFNCMPSTVEMLDHLKMIRSRLKVGSRFLIDLWNGSAVMTDDPRAEHRRFQNLDNPTTDIVQDIEPTVDRINQQCVLRYRVQIIDRSTNTTIDEFVSQHTLLFLTPAHYRQLFELAGLSIIDEFSRGKPGVSVSTSDWYISYLLTRTS